MEGWFNLFGLLLSVLAAVGNSFVVFLIAKSRRLHYPSIWFVLSLAVADFGVGMVVFPIGYLCNLQSKSCNMRVYVAFYWFLVHLSVTNLCCLTWDRYTAIVHPFQYITSMTAMRPGMVISISWLIPMAVSLVMVLGMYTTNSQTAWKVFRLGGVAAVDILGCALLLYAAVRILIVTRAQSLQDAAMDAVKRNLEFTERLFQQDQLSTTTTPARRRKKRKTVRFVIALVTFFLGCYVVVTYLMIRITLSRDVSDKVGWVVTLLLITNSAANPFVYAFLKRDIKKEITRLVCRETRQKCYGGRSRKSTEMAKI